ncbi:UDP-galactopyranose mutase [Megasphaera cerevisiae DSM 20462]|uniref:UDP-galactopyranose mutase n=1 Tax=Megasphaera cerevisiae DSM 20462 TaxID=1122219 RepID=A0A0J6WUV9_9FIRM|nr:UDP-galactopyranose mutase [Megasphaera cerevisiae]KMO85968.1 UDP-galactopyranose mutase [Megasphaera cerevisiae DSM 20462]SKA13383.1 UDP-galactopyranose mutase [Megasphaera cerevisiae DSM 20462]
MYDYLIIGSGLFGCVFAHEMKKAGKSCLVIEKRDHVGGNVYCEEKDGIHIHKYGAHIFHTSNTAIWNYVNQFVEFNHYVNSPVANYKGELYNLPFNMNTFSQMWGVVTPAEAAAKIAKQRTAIQGEPKNLEEQAISLIGTDIYTKLIKGYTEKQWGRSCTDLPAFIIRRLPVRYTFDNNYFNDRYQGIPMGGYTVLIEALLEGIEVRTGVDYNKHREEFNDIADTIIYTGPIDAYFQYRLGQLEYRGLRFETERLEEENYQGVAVMNYTDRETPYTRSIEHKHFEFGTQPVTYVTKEYPTDWKPGEEAYYPVNDDRNQTLYRQYAALAKQERQVVFGGRLAEYKYYDMDDVIASALTAVKQYQ